MGVFLSINVNVVKKHHVNRGDPSIVTLLGKMGAGRDVEIMGKNTNQDFVQNIKEMFNQEMEPIKEAHPGQRIYVVPERPVEKYFMIREKIQD